MKKLSGIAIILTLILLTFCPFALAEGNSPDGNVHFIAPQSLIIDGDKLYVADVVEENKSVILCFDVSGEPFDTFAPKYEFSYEVDDKVTSLAVGNGCIFAVTDSAVSEFTYANTTLTLQKRYQISGVRDVAWGKWNTNDTLYTLSANLYRYNQNSDDFNGIIPVSNGKALLVQNDLVYYLHDNTVSRYDGANADILSEDKFNTTLSFVNDFEPIGICGADGAVLGVYDKNILYKVVFAESEGVQKYDGKSAVFRLQQYEIIDIATTANGLYLLNSNKQIVYYTQNNGSYEPKITIGTDVVNITCPTVDEITSYTLVKPQGYPTNIIYRTNGDNSLSQVVTDYTGSYIIIHYSNENDAYYYVLIGDKFGWVKKADGTTSPTDANSKLQVLDNNVSDNLNYFVSGNSVYVYKLPINSEQYQTSFCQNFSNLTPAKILQKYEQSDGIWYYVEYGENLHGFVRQGAIDSVTAKNDNKTPIVEDVKVNSAFKALTLHLTQDLDENELVYYPDGTVVKLYSGDRVSVVRYSQDNTKAEIFVRQNDGTTYGGWVETQYLMDLHDLSTNVIVGLSVLGTALVLVVILLICFKRKKSKATK